MKYVQYKRNSIIEQKNNKNVMKEEIFNEKLLNINWINIDWKKELYIY